MTMNDPLANVFSNILNCEKIGQHELTIKPSSKFIMQILTLLQEKRYLGECSEIKVAGGNAIGISLIGAINKCGVIKPRYAVKIDNYTKYEKRYLPAKDFGVLIVSTPKGLMTHIEAKEKKLGGRLIGYCY
jgi:small subunit ribosomal protein S8